MEDPRHLEAPVTRWLRPAPLLLRKDLLVREALEEIRAKLTHDAIAYLYLVDAEGALDGVLPVRRLLMAEPGDALDQLAIRPVRSLPANATVLDACEAFAMHKLLAFPVVDAERRVLGVVDVRAFAEELLDSSVEEDAALFEAIGFRVEQVRGAGLLAAWRYRFPWLLATIAGGLSCAVLTSAFQATLERSLTLAFFLTMVLGLGESVSIQTMTMTVQELRTRRPRWRWFRRALGREWAHSALLGLSAGSLAAALAWLWLRETGTALALAAGILAAVVCAASIGMAVPTLLHARRLDPRIAAGPVTLALADLSTLLLYFGLAGWIL